MDQIMHDVTNPTVRPGSGGGKGSGQQRSSLCMTPVHRDSDDYSDTVTTPLWPNMSSFLDQTARERWCN